MILFPNLSQLGFFFFFFIAAFGTSVRNLSRWNIYYYDLFAALITDFWGLHFHCNEVGRVI